MGLLFDAMAGAAWVAPDAGRSKWNWKGRPRVVDKIVRATGEVALEWMIFAIDTSNSWSYQMSTCSGIRRNRKDRRRAVDLVQKIDDDTYRFIELKTDSDTPLHAIREIAGYGAAYRHTRRLVTEALPDRPWMTAPNLRLAVLAPKGWYEGPRDTIRDRKELDW